MKKLLLSLGAIAITLTLLAAVNAQSNADVEEARTYK